MTQTQGPAGSVDPTSPPVLTPGHYGAPTHSLNQSIWWTLTHDEPALLRLDALLSEQVSRAPLPKTHTYITQVNVYRDGSSAGFGDSVTYPEGLLIDYDPAYTYKVEVRAYLEDFTPVDSYLVLRVSNSYTETVQLPDRDVTIVCNDNLYRTEGDVTLLASGSADDAPNLYGITEWIIEDRVFYGHFEWAEAFASPQEPYAYGAAPGLAWQVARRMNDQALAGHYYNEGFIGGHWVGEPGSPPTLTGAAPANRSGGHEGGMVVGYEWRWNTTTFLVPALAAYEIYAPCYQTTYRGLGTLAGPLGDGIKYTYAYPGILQLLSSSLPLHSMSWADGVEFNVLGQAIATVLELYFAPDETATSSVVATGGSLHTLDDNCTALWTSSMPAQYAEGDEPDWGPYLTESFRQQTSEIGSPEDWKASDPTLEVLAVTRGGGEWVPVDVASRKAYEDTLQPLADAWNTANSFELNTIYGFQFNCLPAEMWQESAVDGAETNLTSGYHKHFRGDARFALKMRVRPAGFVGIYEPPLEPATPVFPNLSGTPGPDRSLFWPQS